MDAKGLIPVLLVHLGRRPAVETNECVLIQSRIPGTGGEALAILDQALFTLALVFFRPVALDPPGSLPPSWFSPLALAT